MSLLERIKKDQLEARKAYSDEQRYGKMVRVFTPSKASTTSSLLTTLIGEAAMVGKNAGRDTTDAEVVAVIRKFLKGVDESLRVAGDYRDGDRCTVLWDEKTVLESYLPKQMTGDELLTAISMFDPKIAQKGMLMKFLKDNYAGQYDGKIAAMVVDTYLKG